MTMPQLPVEVWARIIHYSIPFEIIQLHDTDRLLRQRLSLVSSTWKQFVDLNFLRTLTVISGLEASYYFDASPRHVLHAFINTLDVETGDLGPSARILARLVNLICLWTHDFWWDAIIDTLPPRAIRNLRFLSFLSPDGPATSQTPLPALRYLTINIPRGDFDYSMLSPYILPSLASLRLSNFQNQTDHTHFLQHFPAIAPQLTSIAFTSLNFDGSFSRVLRRCLNLRHFGYNQNVSPSSNDGDLRAILDSFPTKLLTLTVNYESFARLLSEDRRLPPTISASRIYFAPDLDHPSRTDRNEQNKNLAILLCESQGLEWEAVPAEWGDSFGDIWEQQEMRLL